MAVADTNYLGLSELRLVLRPQAAIADELRVTGKTGLFS